MADFEQYRDSLKRHYRFQDWLPTVEAAQTTLPRFVFDPATLPAFVHELRRALPGQLNAWTDYFRDRRDPDVRFAVSVTEFASANAAREGLVDHLLTCMSPNVPRAEERGIRVGEIAFAGDSAVQTSVIFVRGNVLVKVDSTGKTPSSVQELAEEMDRQLLARAR